VKKKKKAAGPKGKRVKRRALPFTERKEGKPFTVQGSEIRSQLSNEDQSIIVMWQQHEKSERSSKSRRRGREKKKTGFLKSTKTEWRGV